MEQIAVKKISPDIARVEIVQDARLSASGGARASKSW